MHSSFCSFWLVVQTKVAFLMLVLPLIAAWLPVPATRSVEEIMVLVAAWLPHDVLIYQTGIVHA